MRALIVFLILLLTNSVSYFVNAQNCHAKCVYWEQVSNNLKNEIIASNKINAGAVNYYNGTFRFTDDAKSFRLLDTLMSRPDNEYIRALYFYLFNDVCMKSDGAVSEILGKYCQKMMVNDPVCVLNYFSSHNAILKKYAQLLGYEFCFAKEGVSGIKFNFSDFKKIISSKLEEHSSLKKTFDDFNREVEVMIKNMD